MNPNLPRHTFAVLSCLLPLAGLAQSPAPVTQLDSIVTTASRNAQLKKDVLGDVTVIDKKELEQAGQSSMLEVLSRHHGIEFTDSGGPQTVSGLSLRGTNTNQTLVLINGLRINSATLGSVNWNTIDPATIDRVEIVRGAASSLYGSDAIGGVINIITKKADADRPLSAFANIGYGSYNTFKSSLGFSGADSGWDYSFSTSAMNSNGFSATSVSAPIDRTDNDGYNQRSLAASVGYRWRQGHHIGVTAYNGYNRGDNDAFFTTPEPAYAVTRQQIYSITSTDDITADWQSILRYGFNKDVADNREIDYPNTYGSLQHTYTWQNNVKLTPNQTVSLVLERLEERVLGSTQYLLDSRDTNAAGLIYRGNFGRHHVQASVRNDNITNYGSKTTGGLGYDLDISEQWRISLAANTGFRAPTLGDLYFPSFYPGLPDPSNPNLKPESSRNIEAGLHYESDKTSLGFVAYQNKIQDLIAADSNWVPQNIDSATIRGLTLTGEQRYGKTSLRASADFQNPKDDSNGNQLRRRAQQIYRLNARHSIKQWALGVEYMFVGKRYDDKENKDRLGGYSLWNLTANYDIAKNLAVQVRWNNILNKEYANSRYDKVNGSLYSYNTPGSNVFVNVAWRM